MLKVVAAWNDATLRRAVLDWHGAEAAALDGAGGEASQRYLSLPPSLIGGGTLEIQLNVIGELVLGHAAQLNQDRYPERPRLTPEPPRLARRAERR